MNTLILQIRKPAAKIRRVASSSIFQIQNDRMFRKVKIALVLCIIFSAVIYIASLFLIFNYGSKIIQSSSSESVLADEVSSLNFQLADLQTNFSQDHKIFMDSMQKVSKTNFLREDQTAVSFLSNP